VDAGRLKNIAIIILAALNVCFLLLIGFDRFELRHVAAQEKASVAELFGDSGIRLDPEIVPNRFSAEWYTVSRDRAAETAIVKTLIGNAEAEDRGGNIYSYQNENGSALFRSNGEFEIELNFVDDGAGAGRTAARLLEEMGIAFISEGAEMEEHGNSRGISYLCAWNDSPVLNCSVHLTIYAGGSAVLSGRRINGTPQRSVENSVLNINTVLLRFLDEIKSGGHVCNRLESIELCYNMTSSASGTALEPVWRIVTDGGTYQVNVSSGKIIN